MHIAIDASRTTSAQRTGTENYALRLIQALLELGSPHQFSLYFRDEPSPGLFPALPNVTYRVLSFPRLWTHVRFARALAADHPDVTFVPAHSLPLLFPGRAVVTVHDLGYLHFPAAHTTSSRLYLDLSTRISARRAQTIIADSAATKRDLMAAYGAGEGKIRVVYPGVQDLKRATEPQIAAVREKYQLPDCYLLFIGTLQPRKNINRLVEAYQYWRAANADQEVALVLAGRKGWLSDELKTEGPGVIVTGYVADEDIAALYSGALALVFPSLYEGFGFPVLEAMRCRTAVLCSNTSSLPELAGDAAIMVDPLDVDALSAGIARIVGDSGLRAQLIERGAVQSARFTWQAAAALALAALENA